MYNVYEFISYKKIRGCVYSNVFLFQNSDTDCFSERFSLRQFPLSHVRPRHRFVCWHCYYMYMYVYIIIVYVYILVRVHKVTCKINWQCFCAYTPVNWLY